MDKRNNHHKSRKDLSSILGKKIEEHSARVAVVGVGYVGLPLCVEFAKTGFYVTGLDIDKQRVDSINQGRNYIKDVNDEDLKKVVAEGKLKGTSHYPILKEMDVVIICVPTPLNKVKDPDVSYIIHVLDELVKYLHKEMLIILESTTYPGTTRELVLTRLEETGLAVGKDYYLCYSPERIDPGNREFGIRNTPKVLGGITSTCGEMGALFYRQVVNDVIPLSKPETAEMVKLLENTFRSINIGLVNELAIMCEKLGVDVWEVIEAAATKPFGFMKFLPGPGLGGHCIPVDPHYLAWKMKSFNYRARFIELAGDINMGMPHYVVQLIGKALNGVKKSLKGSHLLILGITYKKDIDDVRESPALDVIELLEDQGAIVEYYDPLVPTITWNGVKKSSLKTLKDKTLRKYDAVVILTDHSNVDYGRVKRKSKLVIDTRNVYPLNHDDHVVRLGTG